MAVSAGIAYVVGGVGVVALDANGTTDCSGTPKMCAPLWSYATPEIAFIAVGVNMEGGLEAYDANGASNCRGTPTVCTLQWTGSGPSQQAPVVGNGFEFVAIVNAELGAEECRDPVWLSPVDAKPDAIGGSVVSGSGGGEVTAFDVNGCGSETVVQCPPLWSTPGTDAIIANGTVYVSTTNTSGAGEIVAYGLP